MLYLQILPKRVILMMSIVLGGSSKQEEATSSGSAATVGGSSAPTESTNKKSTKTYTPKQAENAAMAGEYVPEERVSSGGKNHSFPDDSAPSYVRDPNANNQSSSSSSNSGNIDYEKQMIIAKNGEAEYDLFGYEKRLSGGWQTTPNMIQTPIFRAGISHYETSTTGSGGIFYGFYGSTTNVMNLFETTYFAGVGANVFGLLGAEVQLETAGIGVQISLGDGFVGANINFLGETSITFGNNYELESGNTRTNGITFGLNTGLLTMTLLATYEFLTTGSTFGFESAREAFGRT